MTALQGWQAGLGGGRGAAAEWRPQTGSAALAAATGGMIAAGLLAWASASAAEEPVVTNLTLDAAVQLAVRDNPELNRLRAGLNALRQRAAQAGALPNPMFSYSGMDMASGGSWPDTGEKRYMVQQELPWFGKRGLREDVAGKDAEVMQRELEGMTREVVMMVKESFFELSAVQTVVAIAREEEGVIKRMVKTAGTMYATGERAQADVLKAQAEVTMLKQRILELLAQENTLKARLNTLLNHRADDAIGPVATPQEPAPGGNIEALFAIAATNRPEVKAARAQIERYELERALAAKESVPDYRLGLEYRDAGASEDMVMFTISVDLPVWRSKVHAGIREAEEMRAAGVAALSAAERQSALAVQDASFRLQTARRTLELYRTELIPQAQARFDASDAAYRTGKVDFLDLLESERFLLGSKTMAAMTAGSVGMQAARLERAVGTALPPNGNPQGEGK